MHAKTEQRADNRIRHQLILAALAALWLSACAEIGRWEWTVTQFHMLGDVREKTFTVVPLRPVNNDSLEFMEYAKMVAVKLGHYGMMYRSPRDIGNTDYIVGLDYGIGEPYQVNYSYPIFGQTGGGSAYVSGTVRANGQNANYSGTVNTAPTFGVVGTASGSITNYRQFVRVFVFEGRSADGKPRKLYEGKAEGAGHLNDLTKIVPSGLKALLAEFPGQSGVSKRTTLLGTDQTP